ncbi:ankyrin-2 [Lingula anatina]|uniref:Ankyrin-2 n=1 Tax=Lingula anatina TaxID=7574 RepID=A0A1S3IWB9_LINAN|nr:ankyrin-2 [Lingula anatina]|eukprot:XP_013402484.1 ankyrin-2 [Lingula anatina]
MATPCIIYSCDRQKKKTCKLTTMEALLQDARRLFGYGEEERLFVVLEGKGAEIEDEEILLALGQKTNDVLELVVVNQTRQESWGPVEVPSKLTNPNIQTISINQSNNIQIGDSNSLLQRDYTIARDVDEMLDVVPVQGEKTEVISVIPDPLRRLYALISQPKFWYELDRTARQVDRSEVLKYRDDNGFNVLHAAAFHNNERAVLTIFRHFDWAKLSTQVTSGTHPGELDGCTAKEIALKKHHKSVADRIDLVGKLESELKPIHKAVRSQSIDEIKKTCNCDQNTVNMTGPEKCTPLHIAAGVGFLDGVKLLLKMGADLNAVTEYGETALGRACRMGYDDVVEYLTNLTNIDIKKSVWSDMRDLTCLDAAAMGNYRDIYDRLQRHGLPVTSNTLVCAAWGGHVELVKEIAAMVGIDVNYQNKYGNTALCETSRNGHVDVVKCLINKHKADPSIQNKNGNTALHIAVLNNAGLDVVECLLDEGGADPTILNNDGEDPAHCAARCGQVQYLDAVLRRNHEHRIDPNIQDKYGNTALCKASRNGHVDVVKCLINKYKADSSIQNKNGNTALHIAVLNNVGLDVVECLLDEGGADPTILNNDGENPAHCVARCGQVQYLDAVLRRNHEHRIDPNIQDKYGNTALCKASRNGHVDVVKCLINKYKADSSIQNKNGNTALHIAVLNNVGLDVVECLLDEGGADPTILNNNGENPAHVAAKSGQVQCLDAILRTHPGLMNKRGNLLGEVYLVRGKNGERPAWHYVLVKRKLLADFLVKTNGGSLDVADYGKVLYSGWGKDPPGDSVKKIQDKYNKCEDSAPEDLTPLHHAVLEQHPAVVEKLLELGADTDVRNAYKLTPLHLACMRGNREIVKLLVEAGADTMAADDDGDTPLDVAKLYHQDLTVAFMEKVVIVKFVKDSIQQPAKEIMELLDHSLDNDVTLDVLKTQLHDIIQRLMTGGFSCLAKLNPEEDSSKHFEKETNTKKTDEEE